MRDDGAAAELEVPRSRRIIKRPRLTRLLDEAEARILLLVAPAGYGKTTLGREWISASDRTAVWLDATPARADVESFALALRDSLQTLWPGVAKGLEQRLRAGPPKPAQLGEFLAGTVPSWRDSNWLVIDDYHLLMESADVEALIEAFLGASKCRAMISSRVRPSWATTRRLIYGEIEELGKSALAMTRDEAGQVLQKTRNRAAGLIALADGWPAIIGLAADTKLARFPGEEIESSLYDFFAEELFQAADPTVREGLTVLAFSPSVTPFLANELFGADAKTILEEGIRLGFLDRDRSRIQMHSLIRDFLVRRHSEAGRDREEIVGRIEELLVELRQFDDLFALARTFPASQSLKAATDRVLQELLRDNRLESVRAWLEHAISIRLDSPIVDLATAEIAFREGRYAQSEAAALRSAEALGPESTLRSRAFFRAGYAAYHQNRAEAALKHHRIAFDCARTDTDRLQGIWGLLSATFELERDPTALLAQLEELPKTATTRIRLANARLSYAYRGGLSVSDAVNEAERVLPVLERVDDPMVRSAFLNHLVGHLNLAGRYREAATFVEEEINIAREYGLDFALPHALTLRGMAFTGLRRFADAHADFNRVEHLAIASGDTFSVGNVGVQRIRLLLCKSEPRAACELAESLGPMPTRGTEGELISAHALSAAATGNAHLAEELLGNVEDVTKAVEAEQFVEWTRVVLALRKDTKRARESVRSALMRSLREGCMHAFVCAYRAVPAILDTPGLVDRHSEDLARIFERAHDETLAVRAGFVLDKERIGQLSKRETEVLKLLAEGLSNRAIAGRLFISEVTVKVHVRRIFDKLSVRTRTEAALVAARTLASDGEI